MMGTGYGDLPSPETSDGSNHLPSHKNCTRASALDPFCALVITWVNWLVSRGMRCHSPLCLRSQVSCSFPSFSIEHPKYMLAFWRKHSFALLAASSADLITYRIGNVRGKSLLCYVEYHEIRLTLSVSNPPWCRTIRFLKCAFPLLRIRIPWRSMVSKSAFMTWSAPSPLGLAISTTAYDGKSAGLSRWCQSKWLHQEHHLTQSIQTHVPIKLLVAQVP
jgi:hypothetical protein